MAVAFDPYYKWLGIPPEEQPANHYRLLGLRLFESDPEVIEAASDQRMAHLRTYQTGQYSALSQKLLNEVAGAKVCLISHEKRARYDATLRSAAAASVPVVPFLPIRPMGVDMPVAAVAPLPAVQNPPPLPESTIEPVAPPAVGDHQFDLERLGVSEDAGGNSSVRSASGIGRRTRGPEAFDRRSVRGDKPARKMWIATLALGVILLGLISGVAYVLHNKRTEESSAAESGESFPNSAAGDDAAQTATASAAENAAAEDLQALRKHLRELSIAAPMSPLRATRLGQSLWLHMNFERNTIVEFDKQLFVKDLSGSNHHGICRQGRAVAGRVGDALECETPLRLLSGPTHEVPQFTLLAWVRSPQAVSAAWWFDEDLAGKSLFGLGNGNCLQLRAFSKSKQKTCDPIPLTKLATPPDQWNFIAARSEVRDGATYLTLQVNDQKFTLNNPDLFPVQLPDGKSHAFFAGTPKIQLDELMVFHTALSDAEIQALRGNANPWSVPAGIGQVAAGPPALADPAGGATLPNPNPPTGILLRWQPVVNASRYWLQVELPNRSKPLVDKQDLEETSLHIKLARAVPRETAHDWRWRVRAMVNGQWTDWSETRTFGLADPVDRVGEAPKPDENPPAQSLPVDPDKPIELVKPAEAEKPLEAEKPVESEKPIVRQALPLEAARKQASQVFRDVYKKRYDAARSVEDRLALADDMLHKAEAGNDPAAQYVLMDRARALSANAGDTVKALEIVERIGERFEVDALSMKVETLTDSLQSGVPPVDRSHDLGENVLEVMEQLGGAQKFEAAMQLGGLYRDHARRPVNAALMHRVVVQIKEMRERQQESAKNGGHSRPPVNQSP
jgi:hypothetical protein